MIVQYKDGEKFINSNVKDFFFEIDVYNEKGEKASV